MANIQIPSLTNTVWKFNNILSTTNRGQIIGTESEEGADDNSICYIYLNNEKYDVRGLILKYAYATALLVLIKDNYQYQFMYIKTTDVFYQATTQEGEGWYMNDDNGWAKIDVSRIYLVIKQAYTTTQNYADNFLSELQANATQVTDLTNTKWIFKSQCNYSDLFDPNNPSIITFNVNITSNNVTGTTIKAPNAQYYSALGTTLATIMLGGSNVIYLKTTDYVYTSSNLTDGEGWYAPVNNVITKMSTPPTINIAGGTDATNYDFITWLLDNAEQDTGVRYKTYDLSLLQLSSGTHTVKVKARASGYRDSNFSNVINYYIPYSVVGNITNGTLSGDTSIPINTVGNTREYTITPNSNYPMPENVTVTNATVYAYNRKLGKLYIRDVTGDVVITASCMQTISGSLLIAGCTDNSGNYGGSYSTFSLKYSKEKLPSGSMEYSYDNVTWTSWNGKSVSSRYGILYLRGQCSKLVSFPSITGYPHPDNWLDITAGSYTFIYCFGNIETLINYQTVLSGQHVSLSNDCCHYLFRSSRYNSSSDAYYHYDNNLVKGPDLLSTTLGEFCYYGMFMDCKQLKVLPELPATSILNATYYAMFFGCSNIKLSETQVDDYQTPYRIPVIGTGTPSSTNSLYDMFSGTGGSFTGTPSVNTTYYTSNTIV